MGNSEGLSKQDIELYMLVQFIEVINVFIKYKSINEVRKDVKAREKIYLDYIKKIQESIKSVTLSLYDKDIDDKLEKCKDAYVESTEYETVAQKLKMKTKKLSKKLDDDTKEGLKELSDLIYEICDFKVHLAYELGLIDGIKIKRKCT